MANHITNRYDNNYKSSDDNSDDDYSYNNDSYYDDDGYHSNSPYIGFDDIGDINKIVKECERDLHLLWDTFSSLTSHTSVGHQLDQLVRTTTSPQRFKMVDSTPPGGGPLYIYG